MTSVCNYNFCIEMCKWTASPDNPMLCWTWHSHGWLVVSLCFTWLCPSIAYSKRQLDLPTCLRILPTLNTCKIRRGLKWCPKTPSCLSGLCRSQIAVALGNGRPGHASTCLCRNADGGQTYAGCARMSNQIYVVRIYNFLCSPEGWNYRFWNPLNDNVLWVGYII